MINPLKLLKSKPYIDEIEEDAKSMNKANWKTTLVGIITAGVALATIWAPANYQSKVQATAAALAGVGLIAAKDHSN